MLDYGTSISATPRWRQSKPVSEERRFLGRLGISQLTGFASKAKSIADLYIDFEFVVVAEVNDVVAAIARIPLTTQAFGMDRKQKRCPADRHGRIINCGFDRIHREI